jgi:hypothetical protein
MIIKKRRISSVNIPITIGTTCFYAAQGPSPCGRARWATMFKPSTIVKDLGSCNFMHI